MYSTLRGRVACPLGPQQEQHQQRHGLRWQQQSGKRYFIVSLRSVLQCPCLSATLAANTCSVLCARSPCVSPDARCLGRKVCFANLDSQVRGRRRAPSMRPRSQNSAFASGARHTSASLSHERPRRPRGKSAHCPSALTWHFAVCSKPRRIRTIRCAPGVRGQCWCTPGARRCAGCAPSCCASCVRACAPVVRRPVLQTPAAIAASGVRQVAAPRVRRLACAKRASKFCGRLYAAVESNNSTSLARGHVTRCGFPQFDVVTSLSVLRSAMPPVRRLVCEGGASGSSGQTRIWGQAETLDHCQNVRFVEAKRAFWHSSA